MVMQGIIQVLGQQPADGIHRVREMQKFLNEASILQTNSNNYLVYLSKFEFSDQDILFFAATSLTIYPEAWKI